MPSQDLKALVAAIQHEINNPLQLILGYTDLLLRDSDSRYQKELQEIRNRALLLRRIVQNLKAVAQQEGAIDAETIRQILRK